MSLLKLPCVTVTGSPAQMGEALGESLRALIERLVAHRLDRASEYLQEHGVEGGLATYRAAAEGGLSLLREWDEPGWLELDGTARGAGVPLLDLYASANFTDVRDVATIPHVPCDDDEGCTAFMSPAEDQGDLVVGQTWDLNAGDVEYVVGVHRLPSEGPETWTVTVAGAPTLIGMNEHGLYVGTTNLKIQGARVGVGYMDIQHRAIRERDHAAAASVAIEAPRSAAHSYWYADASGGVELECSATSVVRRDLVEAPIVQTNHCLDDAHAAREPQAPQPSTAARLARASMLIGSGGLTLQGARELMSDRADGVLSINRYPEDGEPTTTNACMIGVPSQRVFEACRGPADRGEWVSLAFERGG
ncbi:MAG: C45 family peptidase [Phycisphaerales bacterium]|nr:C45 family peptidase [Phycisphaerales bacterium]